MVRAALLASIVSACVSCKPGGPDDPIGYGGSTSVVPGHAPRLRARQSPEEVLAGKHRAPVSLGSSLPVSGGIAVVYRYGLLQSYIGERTASGHDVVAELEAEQQRCEDERAALDPGERDYVEAEYQSCEALAASRLFGNEQLVPECEALAVAYFGTDGTLLANVEVGGPCVASVGSFEAYDLTPEPDDELMLVASFDTFGELTHGGWGETQQETSMHVLAIRSGVERVELVEQLDVELAVRFDGGNCNHGIERSARVAGVGVIEVFSKRWNECESEHCIDAEQAAIAAAEAEAAGEDVEEDLPVCEGEPVVAERTRWVPEEKSWTVLKGFPFAGTQLPDGIMR